jgi:hypothetical protein
MRNLKTLFLALAALFLAQCQPNEPSLQKEPAASNTLKAAANTYYFATFGSDSDQKLYVYSSTNATSFGMYSNSGFRGPTGVLRDPGLLYYNGRYYIAFTTQSWTTSSTSFSIASSSDLVSWSTIATVNSGVANTYYTWAPDWYVEGSTVRLIVNIGPSGSMRPYIYTAQNSSLTSWSAPVDMGIGTNHIDAFVVKSGSTYHCYAKNESTKNIVHFTSTNLTGGWTLRHTYWNGYEGISVIQQENGVWRMYIDHYSAGDGLYTTTSSDLNTWSGLSRVGFGRHGSIIRTATLPTTKWQNVQTGLYMDGLGFATNGANAGQWSSSGSTAQQWIIETTGSYVKIKNVLTGMYIDGAGRTANGSIVAQYGGGSSNNQQWQRTASGSNFRFANRATGLFIDGGGSAANGANLMHWGNTNSLNQQWRQVIP